VLPQSPTIYYLVIGFHCSHGHLWIETINLWASFGDDEPKDIDYIYMLQI
jgi:hypothetical protein